MSTVSVTSFKLILKDFTDLLNITANEFINPDEMQKVYI